MTSPLLLATGDHGDRNPDSAQLIDWAERIATSARITFDEACDLLDIVLSHSAFTGGCSYGERYVRQVEQAAGETANWTHASIVARLTAASCLAQSLERPAIHYSWD